MSYPDRASLLQGNGGTTLFHQEHACLDASDCTDAAMHRYKSKKETIYELAFPARALGSVSTAICLSKSHDCLVIDRQCIPISALHETHMLPLHRTFSPRVSSLHSEFGSPTVMVRGLRVVMSRAGSRAGAAGHPMQPWCVPCLFGSNIR
jgi:hypothetical protein